METKEFDLMQKVTDVFMKKGIKSITMDDMSKELKVSKKTLYKYVKNRPELVLKSMNWKLAYDRQVITGITNQNHNPIDELCHITEYFVDDLTKMNPSIHSDLQKHYKDAWKAFDEYRTTFLYEKMVNNMKRGVSEGIYRDTFDPEVIAKVYITKIDMVFDSRIFPTDQFNFGQVYTEMIKYHIYGIANEKGLAVLEKCIAKKAQQ